MRACSAAGGSGREPAQALVERRLPEVWFVCHFEPLRLIAGKPQPGADRKRQQLRPAISVAKINELCKVARQHGRWLLAGDRAGSVERRHPGILERQQQLGQRHKAAVPRAVRPLKALQCQHGFRVEGVEWLACRGACGTDGSGRERPGHRIERFGLGAVDGLKDDAIHLIQRLRQEQAEAEGGCGPQQPRAGSWHGSCRPGDVVSTLVIRQAKRMSRARACHLEYRVVAHGRLVLVKLDRADGAVSEVVSPYGSQHSRANR